MTLLIGFLTFLLVVNCLFLILLILIQLPKKEAGAGIAFGGAATDALFGAGQGNALTQMTKYTSGIFVGLSVVLSMMNTHQAREGTRRLEQELSRHPAASAPASSVLPKTPASPGLAAPITVAPPAAKTQLAVTNLMSSGITNQAPKPAASAPGAAGAAKSQSATPPK